MNINLTLLKEQKKSLILFLDDNNLSKKRIKHFEGIIYLLDAIEDSPKQIINVSKKWLEIEINEQEFEIEKRAEKNKFPMNDKTELYSNDVEHQAFERYSKEELQDHNFDLGMYKAYKNVLLKIKNDAI